MDLAAFLRARVGEDAAVAHAASHPDQDRDGDPRFPVGADESWHWVRDGESEPLKGATGFAPREGAQGGHQWVHHDGRQRWAHTAIPGAQELRLESRNRYMLRASPDWAPHWVLDAPRGLTYGVAAHIAVHDPVRVLSEVAAKLRIIEAFEAGGVPEYVLRVLAWPYRGHPDYDASWNG
ncbi:DUF6221 family protein [Phytomonospora endophytica]|uniref:Uncharacterized protein n=1 Tax=Phytomonospora endophytica TaxID=714109 RepID=A0A841FEZ6_9ACTN|nr:DUF6221 family protein [Phytomonospora endophytica]MBB6034414.1 hypothetical protein [Phytomonospora endophytica]GIG66808.1 hypothetical protein Pen01_31030 [Phytomonospora endophytica]